MSQAGPDDEPPEPRGTLRPTSAGTLAVSAVLGLVGAGGIGVVLDDAINFFDWQKVATVLLAILAVVVIAEVVVTRIRARLI